MIFLRKLLQSFLNRLYRLYINENIIMFRLSKLTYQSSDAIIKKVDFNNLHDILFFQDKKYVKEFSDFLKLGDEGYYAYLEKRCIHRSWLKTNKQTIYLHPNYSYKLKKGEVFIHYCETALKARGRNIYPHVLSEIIKKHPNEDILIAVNQKNIPSIKGIKKVGFKELYRVRILIILGIKFIKIIEGDYK